jgi:acyl dehydratase
MPLLTRTITAFNTATASENKIHDDAVAGRFGFTGGLVPGVDVFAYMAHGPVEIWGRDWLSEGTISARFEKPVYDGDEATLTVESDGGDELVLTLTARGLVCAKGRAARWVAEADPKLMPVGVLPALADRPPASPESLPVGHVLGTLHELYLADVGLSHLINTREDPDLFDGGAIANPAYLLRRANYVLAQSVKLGPWIHLESDVRLHGLLHGEETFETRAVVADNLEINGHRMVDLDFTISTHGRLLMSGRHRAIYQPRQVRAAAAS